MGKVVNISYGYLSNLVRNMLFHKRFAGFTIQKKKRKKKEALCISQKKAYK